jgi:hypothetical protein
VPKVPPSPETQGETKLPEVRRTERLQAQSELLEAWEIVDRAREIADLSFQRLFKAIRRLNHVDRELRAGGVIP